MMDARRNLIDSQWAQGAIAAANNGGKGSGLASLTAREREVVERAIAGSTNKSIAFDLGIADATVRVLLWRAYGKLGVRSRRDLIDKACVLCQLEQRAKDGVCSELEARAASGAGA